MACPVHGRCTAPIHPPVCLSHHVRAEVTHPALCEASGSRATPRAQGRSPAGSAEQSEGGARPGGGGGRLMAARHASAHAAAVSGCTAAVFPASPQTYHHPARTHTLTSLSVDPPPTRRMCAPAPKACSWRSSLMYSGAASSSTSPAPRALAPSACCGGASIGVRSSSAPTYRCEQAGWWVQTTRHPCPLPTLPGVDAIATNAITCTGAPAQGNREVHGQVAGVLTPLMGEAKVGLGDGLANRAQRQVDLQPLGDRHQRGRPGSLQAAHARPRQVGGASWCWLCWLCQQQMSPHPGLPTPGMIA